MIAAKYNGVETGTVAGCFFFGDSLLFVVRRQQDKLSGMFEISVADRCFKVTFEFNRHHRLCDVNEIPWSDVVS